MGNKFRLDQKIAAFKKVKDSLPIILGNEALNFFLKSFDNGGFTDASLQKWDKRKAGAPRNNGRALLIDTGDLRRSIKVSYIGGKAIISSDLIYASVINYGLRSGRGAGFMMPQRKFVGRSAMLQAEMKLKIIKKISGIFK